MTAQTEGPEWLDARDVCRVTGLSLSTIERRVKDGTLPAYRISRRKRRFHRDDVAALFVPIPID